jgi:squalene-hopene/tetraprenyl-beta-curcumene cyclase
MTHLSLADLEQGYQKALAALLAERHPEGYWIGELSTSALSTATACGALALMQCDSKSSKFDSLIDRGLAWLEAHQNPDGGWGDTIKSLSNISTTMLCRAAFYLGGASQKQCPCLERAEKWLAERFGSSREEHAEAVRSRYGKDRTFSVPILTMCALAGLVSWREVPPLPFELACWPQSWFRFLRLHVVSYALPALIAIGQAVFHHRPPWNPITRWIRRLARSKSLSVLERIQPAGGGFLEATPLTSFVVMSLAGIGQSGHPVARRGTEFLVKSVRPDGSWPIDTNLSTWVTTLAIQALARAGELDTLDKKVELQQWLIDQQYRERHPYTGADPGGWAWTPLSGGVPDADDTPGALLALAHLGVERGSAAVKNGLGWLALLQNRDGGWPTFCRGWGHLPFDRSGADLTAHVVRAFAAWGRNGEHVVQNGFCYLARAQGIDGSWLPLWFGNQHARDDENPTYGTARVLAAYRDVDMMNSEPARRGIGYLLANQNADGGWGGGTGTPSSIEETAVAVDVLVDAPEVQASGSPAAESVNKGLAWLVEQVEAGNLGRAAPIGFYFAKLWYFEKLYPIIFSVAALGRARRKLAGRLA